MHSIDDDENFLDGLLFFSFYLTISPNIFMMMVDVRIYESSQFLQIISFSIIHVYYGLLCTSLCCSN